MISKTVVNLKCKKLAALKEEQKTNPDWKAFKLNDFKNFLEVWRKGYEAWRYCFTRDSQVYNALKKHCPKMEGINAD